MGLWDPDAYVVSWSPRVGIQAAASQATQLAAYHRSKACLSMAGNYQHLSTPCLGSPINNLPKKHNRLEKEVHWKVQL